MSLALLAIGNAKQSSTSVSLLIGTIEQGADFWSVSGSLTCRLKIGLKISALVYGKTGRHHISRYQRQGICFAERLLNVGGILERRKSLRSLHHRWRRSEPMVIPFPTHLTRVNKSQEIGTTERLALAEHERLLTEFTKAVCEKGSSALVRKWSRILDEHACTLSTECGLRTDEEGIL